MPKDNFKSRYAKAKQSQETTGNIPNYKNLKCTINKNLVVYFYLFPMLTL